MSGWEEEGCQSWKSSTGDVSEFEELSDGMPGSGERSKQPEYLCVAPDFHIRFVPHPTDGYGALVLGQGFPMLQVCITGLTLQLCRRFLHIVL